jgi:hypothetical protein
LKYSRINQKSDADYNRRTKYMKTIRIKVYKFNELSQDAQNKAIDKLRDINVDFDWWEPIIEGFDEILHHQGFEDAEIYFSGFYSQGDGLCFDAKINLDKFELTNQEKRISKLINNNYIDNFYIAKNSYSNHYSHEKTRYIDYYEITHENINKALNSISTHLESKRLEYCKKFYSQLEEYYNELRSDEAIIETIEANDYDFLANGELFN